MEHRAVVLMLMVCLALGGAWGDPPTPTPSTSPSHAPAATPRLAILIIGDQSNPGMTNMEKVLAQNVRLEQKARGIAERSLPLIYYHVDKPAERRFCEHRLGIHGNELLFAAVVEHENYVVRTILYREERIQVPESTAGSLVEQAADFLRAPTLPTLPDSPTASDSSRPTEDLRKAFESYLASVAELQAGDDRLAAQYQDLSSQRQQGILSPQQFADAVERQLLPAARDQYAKAQKLNLESSEVVHLQQAYIEHSGYVVKAYEALADGLKGNSTVLMNLSQSYVDLGASALKRWQTDQAALTRKYGIAR